MAAAQMRILLLVLVVGGVWGDRDDLACLLRFRASVGDPEGHLTSWAGARSLCSWYGVTCYGNMAPPVYFLKLSGSRLTGAFPQGLRNCTALTRLDLSDNAFTGPIPPSLCADLPNLVSLDLSKNALHGPIPQSLASCPFLNDLLLSQNLLSGPIPPQIASLPRLQHLDLSSNRLTGPIPSTFQNHSAFDASCFLNNTSLCGHPLTSKCKQPKKAATAGVIVGGAVGSAVAILIISALIFCYVVKKVPKGRRVLQGD